MSDGVSRRPRGNDRVSSVARYAGWMDDPTFPRLKPALRFFCLQAEGALQRRPHELVCFRVLDVILL